VSYTMGTGAVSPGVKRQGREADHSPPSSAEVKDTSDRISIKFGRGNLILVRLSHSYPNRYSVCNTNKTFRYIKYCSWLQHVEHDNM
jgi:hypothetical protein